MRGQVQDEPSAGGRDPGGDVQDARAHSGPPGGAHRCGDSGGAGDVERDHAHDDPGRVRRVLARWQVGQGAVLEFGDDLLDQGVVAVTLIGLDRGQGAVGDEGVVAVGREQLALLGCRRMPVAGAA